MIEEFITQLIVSGFFLGVSIGLDVMTYRKTKNKGSIGAYIFPTITVILWVIIIIMAICGIEPSTEEDMKFFSIFRIASYLFNIAGILIGVICYSRSRKFVLKTNGLQGNTTPDSKGNEITTNYHDEIVLQYFSNEQKSGCFGRKPKWTDKDYDNMLLRWLNANATKEFALHKLGVDESQVNEIEPICFQGFESEDTFIGRYGLDGKFRTSQYSVTWLFFSDSQIFVFNIFYDLLYHKTKIITYEYFYKDITNFSSIFSSYEYEKLIERKGCMSKGFDKELKKIETQKFSIVVPGDSFSCSVSGVAKIDGIIQGLKQKLREKKEQRG